MPARNAIKPYVENSYYHLYNRGVEKRVIFIDSQDCAVFLSYLKEYLLPKDELILNQSLINPNISWNQKNKILKKIRLNNFSQEITLLSFCLMPNHFHILLKQRSPQSINRFMRSLCTRYSMYFNRKYNRVGSLFQAVYKAVLVTNDAQLLHLTRYIHKQALLLQGESLQKTEQPCSYPEYVGERKTTSVKPDEVLAYFSKNNPERSYQSFLWEQEDVHLASELTLDEVDHPARTLLAEVEERLFVY